MSSIAGGLLLLATLCEVDRLHRKRVARCIGRESGKMYRKRKSGKMYRKRKRVARCIGRERVARCIGEKESGKMHRRERERQDV